MRSLLCVFVLLLLSGGAVYAQDEDAAALYQSAEKSYKLQRYDEALKSFQRSYELSNEPAILFNIGQCYRQLGQLEEAKKSFLFFVRDAADHPKRSAAEKLIKELEQELQKQAGKGSLQLSSKQSGVELFVDGTSRGNSPLLLEDISPGEHLITAKRAGFADYQLSVVVKPSQHVELSIPQLVPLSGSPVAELPARPFFLAGAGLGGASVLSLLFTGLAVNRAIKEINFEVRDVDTNKDGEVDRDELIAQGVEIDESIDAIRNRSILSAVIITSTAASLVAGLALKKKASQTEAK